MRTLDQTTIRAPVERAFEAASQVERWPEILPHYRWVRFLERRESGGMVEMAAWRPFGPLRYPTWWGSAGGRTGARRPSPPCHRSPGARGTAPSDSAAGSP